MIRKCPGRWALGRDLCLGCFCSMLDIMEMPREYEHKKDFGRIFVEDDSSYLSYILREISRLFLNPKIQFGDTQSSQRPTRRHWR